MIKKKQITIMFCLLVIINEKVPVEP